jgi:DNA-binding Xre family transcriptional regulator
LRGKLRNRFQTLLTEKERRENRRISRNELLIATDVTLSTILRWERNQVTKFEAGVIEAFCAYFECSVGELLYIEPDDDDEA